MSEVDQLYLEDLHIGQRFTSGTHVMEEAKIKEFAAEFDPQPCHLDASAAQSSVFKGLAASDWHTAAIALRLLVSGGLPLANGIVGLGVEITWPRPTRPGDICASKAKSSTSPHRDPNRTRPWWLFEARC